MSKLKRYKERKFSINLEKKKDKLSDTVHKQWVQRAYDLMKDGYSVTYIKDLIKAEKEGSVAESNIQFIIHQAYRLVADSQFTKQEEIRAIHIDRYNKQIKRLKEVKDPDDLIAAGKQLEPKEYWALREKKIFACYNCLETLKQKEELLQFHNKDFVIEVNTEQTIEIKEDQPKKYDISKLTLQEQIEFYHLFKQAKKTESELYGVIISNEESKVETIDVEAEVINELPNIEQIEKIQLPAPAEGKKTINQVSNKLAETLKKLAAEKFGAVGTLTNEEKELIK